MNFTCNLFVSTDLFFLQFLLISRLIDIKVRNNFTGKYFSTKETIITEESNRVIRIRLCILYTTKTETKLNVNNL